MTKLYDYWRSSASYRVRIALGLAGINWKTVSIDLVAGDQRSEEYLRRNPQGLVPALELDGQLMTQSLAIIEYLDETRKLGLLPAEAAHRARARALAHAIAIDIHPVCNLRVVRQATSSSAGEIKQEEWMRHFIGLGLATFETMIEPGEFCYGGRVGLADICLAPQLYNANRWGVNLTDMPNIQRIAANLDTIPAFQAAHPDRAPH